MTQRLGSPAVMAALQRFLRRDGGSVDTAAGDGSDMVPRSELWRQVQGSVWDVCGKWVVTTMTGKMRQELVLSPDGSASYEAADYPAAMSLLPGLKVTGTWSNLQVIRNART